MRKISVTVAILFLALALGIPAAVRAQWIEDGLAVAVYANNQDGARIVPDGHGGAFIVWRDYRNTGQSDIYMQRVNSRGEELWTHGGIPVAEGTSQQGDPAICVGTSGYAVVAYRDNASGNYDIYAQCVNLDGDLVWAEGGMPVCTHTSIQGAPHIVSCTSGYYIIGWTDSRNGNEDVFAQRLNWNGVRQWGSDGVVICNAANLQADMQMTTDGAGGAIFVWEDLRDGADLVLYAQKIASTGFVSWTANGVRLSSSDYWQNQPQIASNGAGGAYITWYEERYGVDNDIFIQCILTGGNVIWTSAGKYVCLENGNQYYPQLVPDGSGGVFITWQDGRLGGGEYDIYAQKVNASGDAQWGIGGVCVSNPPGMQNYPMIISDGSGGAIIAWQDQRGLIDYDISAQRINSSGTAQWTSQGAIACSAVNNQSLPKIASDGAHGAFIVWGDRRDDTATGADLYAQRIEQWGYWGYPSPVLTGGYDVPNDQGGSVLLTWDASRIDAYPDEVVVRYSIFMSTDGTNFSQIDSMDAYYLGQYQYAAATTADSSGLGDADHWFKIRARTYNNSCWWESNVISCHSVDNLSPSPPVGLAAGWSHEPEGLELTWTAAPGEDIASFAVYRGASGDFEPGDQNRLAVTEKASYVDCAWNRDAGYFYKVSAIDAGGNESGYALLEPGSVAGGDEPGVPKASYLAQNYPNPFNPSTRIDFGLGAPSWVSLRIYDAAGKLVRVLAEGERAAGTYSEYWDGMTSAGTRAASGVYFYKLRAGDLVETRKMVMLK